MMLWEEGSSRNGTRMQRPAYSNGGFWNQTCLGEANSEGGYRGGCLMNFPKSRSHSGKRTIELCCHGESVRGICVSVKRAGKTEPTERHSTCEESKYDLS